MWQLIVLMLVGLAILLRLTNRNKCKRGFYNSGPPMLVREGMKSSRSTTSSDPLPYAPIHAPTNYATQYNDAVQLKNEEISDYIQSRASGLQEPDASCRPTLSGDYTQCGPKASNTCTL